MSPAAFTALGSNSQFSIETSKGKGGRRGDGGMEEKSRGGGGEASGDGRRAIEREGGGGEEGMGDRGRVSKVGCVRSGGRETET